jgi:soluble lytic murein transglycosylase-like protein
MTDLLKVLLLVVSISIQPAFAQTLPKPKAEPSGSPNPLFVLTPIDQLEAKIKKNNRSKTALQLKKAYAAFQDGKYSTAVQLASKSKGNETFGDYSYWISASANRAQSMEQIEKGNFSSGLEAAEKSFQSTLQIEQKFPYSPFLRSTQKELAQSELLVAEAFWGLKKWKKSQQSYERAFQRLLTQNTLFLARPLHLNHYSGTCKKTNSALCLSWLQKFSLQYSKKTEEVKAIAEYFPDVPEQTKPFRPPAKLTAPYKAPDADSVSFDSGMKLYLDEKYSDAAKSFRQFLDDYPRSGHRFKARYWLAQTLAKSNDDEKSLKMYEELQQDSPLTFYGLLAAQSIGKPIDIAISSKSPLATESDPLLTPQELQRLTRAKYFLAEDAKELAGMELKDFKARDGLTSPFLIYLANLQSLTRNYRQGFQVLGELFQRGHKELVSNFGLKMIFPIEHLDVIKKYSTLNELDPVLVLSLVKQESAFAEDAGSHVGAMGLMQLMPTTAIEVDPKIQVANLHSIEDNVRIGTKYFKKLLSRFNGNIVLALAGYNAGPNAADRWVKEAGAKRSMLEFIEGIPYRETREYVIAIIRNYFWYCRLLSIESPKGVDYFWKSYGPSELTVPQGPNVPKPAETNLTQQNGSA